MSKEWKTLPTINDVPKTKYKGTKTFNKLMAKTPTRDEEALKKHNDESFAKQEFEEAQLLDAFANKKLKSKTAIKKALGLAKKKKNDAGKSDDKAAKPQDNPTVEGQ